MAASSSEPDVRERLAEGARDYNDGRFWEAHEAWEEAWLSLRDAGREADADLVQGLILATAAFENLDRGKPAGFATQGAKALHRLRRHASRGQALGLGDLEAFREGFLEVYLDVQRLKLEHMDELEPEPPRLDVHG